MSDKVQPETSAECSLRDRVLLALACADGQDWASIADASRHTIEIMYGKQVDAVLAVRDDALAEKDAEIELCREGYEHDQAEIERLRVYVMSLKAHGRACGDRAEAAEAEVARLREIDLRALAESIAKDATSPSEWRARGWRLQAALIDTIERRLDAALAPRESATEDEWLAVDPRCTCVHMDGKRHQSPSCTVQHAESAPEAPRTRDGEQGGER